MAKESPKKYDGPERREKQPCDICVKDDFATVKKLVFIILTACILSGGIGGWAAFASNAKDSEQDSRITAIETNQANILKNQEDQSAKLDKLINLSVNLNLDLQTHIARNPGR